MINIPLPNFFGHAKYYLYLLRKRNDTFESVKKFEFKVSEKVKKVNLGSFLKPHHETYYLNLRDVSFSQDNRHYLFKDVDTGATLTFNHYDAAATPQDADTLNATGLVAAAMHMIGNNYGVVVLLLALGFGAFLGFVIGQNIEGIVGAFQ